MSNTVPAVVRHINKNHVTIAPAAGYSVVLFKIADKSLEAVVASDDGSETIRLLVASPEPGWTMQIKTDHGSGVTDIIYAKANDVR